MYLFLYQVYVSFEYSTCSHTSYRRQSPAFFCDVVSVCPSHLLLVRALTCVCIYWSLCLFFCLYVYVFMFICLCVCRLCVCSFTFFFPRLDSSLLRVCFCLLLFVCRCLFTSNSSLCVSLCVKGCSSHYVLRGVHLIMC